MADHVDGYNRDRHADHDGCEEREAKHDSLQPVEPLITAGTNGESRHLPNLFRCRSRIVSAISVVAKVRRKRMAPVIYKAGRTSDCSDAFPKPAAIVAVIGRMDSVGSCGKELFPPARMTTIIVSPMARAIGDRNSTRLHSSHLAISDAV